MITMQVMESEALNVLNRLANIDTKALHKKVAKIAEQQVKDKYFERWIGRRRTLEVYSPYAKIKEYLQIGALGFLTGSTYHSIRGISHDNEAEIKLVGRWPNRGFFGEKEIPIDAVIDFSRYKSEYKDMPTKFLGGYVTVSIDSSGMHIRWPKLAESLGFTDRDYPAEDYSTKEFGVFPGLKGNQPYRKNPIDFMYLDESQSQEIYDFVSRHIDRLLGAEKTERPKRLYELEREMSIKERQESAIGKVKTKQPPKEEAKTITITKEALLKDIEARIAGGVTLDDLEDEINRAMHIYGLDVFREAQAELQQMIRRHFH